MKADDFSYKQGTVETNVPWFPPDPQLLNNWRDDFFQTPGVFNYTFWLCGAVMEKRSTSDVDIIITGEMIDYTELDRLMTTAIKLGFKHRQLIDIAWSEYYRKFLMKGNCPRRAICCEHFYEHDWCDLDECTKVVNDVEAIVVGNEVVKNGQVICPSDPKATQLTESLWKIKFQSPSPVQVSRMLSGEFYQYPPVIITPELDFKELVDWP